MHPQDNLMYSSLGLELATSLVVVLVLSTTYEMATGGAQWFAGISIVLALLLLCHLVTHHRREVLQRLSIPDPVPCDVYCKVSRSIFGTFLNLAGIVVAIFLAVIVGCHTETPDLVPLWYLLFVLLLAQLFTQLVIMRMACFLLQVRAISCCTALLGVSAFWATGQLVISQSQRGVHTLVFIGGWILYLVLWLRKARSLSRIG